MAADLQQVFLSLPPVTRTLLAASGLTTVPTLLGLLSPYSIVFLPRAVRRGQVWRLITPFFYAGSGLSALFNGFFLFRTSRDLEAGVFKNRSYDLAWALLCMCASIIALNYPLKSVIFFRALLLALTHLWAQYDPEQPMNLYGFVTIPAKYLSYALLAMDLLQGGPSAAMEGLTGIISAHAFHYLAEVHPRTHPNAKRYMDTPRWFKKLFGAATGAEAMEREGQRSERNVAGGVTGIVPPPSMRRAPNVTSSSSSTTRSSMGGGHTWGSGNRLGTD